MSEIKNDKVLKKKKVDSDNEADDTNHYSGDWIVAEFIVQSKKNRYVGQIKSTETEIDDHFLFQFYRKIDPFKLIFTKLSLEEVQPKRLIKEKLLKPSIISSDKIQLKETPSSRVV